jgi:hypothetical protein
MRLLTLTAAAATALLGTGCMVPCDTGSLTIDWSLRGPGGGSIGCAAAGVDFVDIYVNGVRQVDAARCTDGTARIFGVPEGSREVTVEGVIIDNSTVPATTIVIDRDQFPINVSCGDSRYLATPGEATLELAYSFSDTSVCDSRPSFIWYQVTDLISGDPISSITSQSSTADRQLFACSTFPTFAIPWGRYRVDWIGEVVSPLSSPSVPYQQCTPSVVKSVFAPGTFTIDSVMAPTVGSTCVL